MERQGGRAAARMAEVAEARPGHSPLAGNQTLAVTMEEYINAPWRKYAHTNSSIQYNTHATTSVAAVEY
jgi:hypothetical protein